MTDLPPLSIALVTYNRTAEALQTVLSTCEHLQYPRELRAWYVADDGSENGNLKSILSALKENGERMIGSHGERIRADGQEETFYAGLGWNRALGLCHQNSDFVLWLEDDWRLPEGFDLVPYVRLLQEREDVGAVSFRILSVGNDVHTVGHDGRHYLKYLRTTQYSYSGNPILRHARFTKFYGWFHEERSPGDIELDLDSRFRAMVDGPDIWRPVAISPWGAWEHIGTIKTWD